MDILAPIGLSAYARLDHLKQNIAALKNNYAAAKSHLYIFSDGPKDGDHEKVSSVRNYLRKIDGFKKIELVERKQNSRIMNNRNGIKDLLDRYGKIIFLEEDIVTAPGFLDFMNNALNVYANDERIFSITGYTPPINATKFSNEDVFFLPRFNAWGFGIWKDRFQSIRYFDRNELRNIFKKIAMRKYISEYVGEDVLLMLQYESENVIDALDVKAIFQQILTRRLTVYPRISLTRNIGHDGSGLHCDITDKYDTPLWEKTTFEFTKNISINHDISEAHRNFRMIDHKKYLVYLAKRYRVYTILRNVKSVLKAFLMRLI